jgi:chemotaxis protein MotA
VKAITGIGIAGAFAALLLAVLMEGGSPASLINIPAFIVVAGGTAAATVSSMTLVRAKRMPKLAMLAMKGGLDIDHGTAVRQMVRIAEKARRDGLLALEDDLSSMDDAYTKTGLQLVVDGADSEVVRAILQSEIDGMAKRHAENAGAFVTAGGFAPTLGILGTVLSLVHVLENLNDPGSLGHSIAGAFLATLYGVGSANLIFLPLGNKLKELAAEELLYREMLLEAILSIQAGENPRMLAEKLETFLEPGRREGADALRSTGSSASAEQLKEAA